MVRSGLLALLPAAALAATTHKVNVGDAKGSFVFEPAELKAAVGDKVEFHFYPNAHSVAQSSFDSPCKPLNSSTPFFSGKVMVEKGKVSDQVYTIEVKDDKPIWYYCATGPHCSLGMSGVINPPANGNTLKAYQEAAKSVKPGVEPSATGGGELAKATSPPATPTPSPSSGAGSDGGSDNGSDGGSQTGGDKPEDSGKPGAGVEAYGSIRWGLMSVGLAMAGFVGGLVM